MDRNEYLILPDAALLKIFKNRRRLQKLLSAVPMAVLAVCVVIYGFSGWVNFLQAEYTTFRNVSDFGAGIILYIAVFINGLSLLNDNEKTQKLNMAAFGVIYAVIIGGYILSGIGLSVMQLIMIIYIYAAELIDIKLIKEIKELKSLPSYPFNNERRTMIAESSLSREKMIEHLNNIDNDGCVQPDFEKILEGESIETSDDSDRDDFLQKHKRL